ncbi:FecR family protein [Sphingobacterium faecale]|uniref:FecR domain-containing protein n=1 Tax=Sphingobacterium faecale TaxID=2803775 RepID=A0ABS1R7Z2_9SPHI|nr:FecR family protein [Sphingobacterium faecale]MBL1410836.1 FecR domain-containing protein [Sphingobacterium faecale]
MLTIKECLYLLKKYTGGKASSAEKALIEQAYNTMESQQASQEVSPEQLQIIGETLHSRIINMQARSKQKRLWYYSGAAAALLLFASVWIWSAGDQNTETNPNITVEHVFPNGKAPIAILPNGRRIHLDHIKSGIAMTPDALLYTDGSPITETTDWTALATPLIEIITPRGTQYHIVLEDGTKVWLNAGSRLKYPLHFHQDQRHVELDGEAFFEVAHQQVETEGIKRRKPFVVKTSKQQVNVLGTAFNVYDYSLEHTVRTTLLQGKVQVDYPASDRHIDLLPNEQSTWVQGTLRKENVDAELVSNWREGYLSFDEASLSDVATYLSRWYDIDVIVKGKPGSDKFQGRISKQEPLSKILRILHEANVKYTFDKNLLTLHL